MEQEQVNPTLSQKEEGSVDENFTIDSIDPDKLKASGHLDVSASMNDNMAKEIESGLLHSKPDKHMRKNIATVGKNQILARGTRFGKVLFLSEILVTGS